MLQSPFTWHFFIKHNLLASVSLQPIEEGFEPRDLSFDSKTKTNVSIFPFRSSWCLPRSTRLSSPTTSTTAPSSRSLEEPTRCRSTTWRIVSRFEAQSTPFSFAFYIKVKLYFSFFWGYSVSTILKSFVACFVAKQSQMLTSILLHDFYWLIML